MTAVEIATGIIDKLQEENRACLDTLHKAQDKIKHQERQLAEKDRLISVLEERLRTGTDGILEMSNRQKELTIKHLEMQIQKLLKENEEMESKLEAVKAEICAKCETKLLLRENSENKSISKSYKPSSSSTISKALFEKKTSHSLCPNRLKSLERIIDHKDKRITHLSKEVQRLTKIEKELTQKIYRLTKLLPMSRLPSETVTDCLLQEIQLLESEKQSSDQLLKEDLLKTKSKPSACAATKSKVNFSTLSSISNIQKSKTNLPRQNVSDEVDMTKAENEVLFRKLQKLYNDVNELKRLFLFESEKLSRGLNSSAKEYSQFKEQLEDIINNLNEVVQSILNNHYFQSQNNSALNVSAESDDKYVISCLQERLKDSLGLITEYENEIKSLNEKLNQLTTELSVKERSDCKVLRSTSHSSKLQDVNDVQKLKEVIKIRETQLEAAESHINTCQRFIEELQKTYKHLNLDSLKLPIVTNVSKDERSANKHEVKNKELQTKLEVAEKNIKTCEGVIEQLQNTIKRFEEENDKLENELHMVKSQKFSKTDKSKSKGGEVSQILVLRKLNLELMEKVKALESANLKLETDLKLHENKNSMYETTAQENNLLKNQLEASEKQISSLQKSIETLQEKLRTADKHNSELENELRNINQERNLVEKYETDVTALRNELLLKEQENNELKESLHMLESKTLEMNHYRKSLHIEIEKLCNALMENDDSESDSSRRKAIYKAAVLHSAQALLSLDENFNLKQDESGQSSALDELKHQIEVYLTEVSRIHELVTIKEQERDDLLKEYLDLDDGVIRGSSSQQDARINELRTETNLQSMSTMHNINNLESDVSVAVSKAKSHKEKFETSIELRMLQEEITATKSVTTYLLTSCTRLEDLLAKEKTERAKCESELEIHKEMIKDLKSQLNVKNTMAKRLNSLVDAMRSKECNDEITLEQLKSEIKWLIEENQKVFDRVSTAQSELCLCKEENSRIQNDLDSIKHQLLNEKYEHAKVLNELKHLRVNISQYQSASSET